MAALQAAGDRVVAVQNPLTSLADDVSNTRRVLDTIEGPVVLAGHSYGGAVIGSVAEGDERVTALVYVAAYVPVEGETVLGLGERVAPTRGAETIRATEDGWLTLETDSFPAVFAADVPPEHARVLAAVQKPTHGACFGSPAGAQGWPDRPVSYVRSLADLMIAPDLQVWMAQRAGATLHDVESSHASPLSHGPRVAEVIRSASRPA